MELKNITFALIKPEAVASKKSGKIIDMIEQNGFDIIRLQKVMLNQEFSEVFYDVHKERPFFGELVEFIHSGPVIIMALHKENAINAWRDLIGATDPAKAEQGTIRQLFGTDIGKNAVHGSDSPETAVRELELFFPEMFAPFMDNNDENEEDDEDECDKEDDECCGDTESCNG